MTTWRIRDGDPTSPVVLHAPHGSQAVPPDTRGDIVLDDTDLQIELDRMTDAGTGELAAAVPGPWVFENLLSRLVVDPERLPDDREEMLAVGMGAVYTHTSTGAVLRSPDPGLVPRFFDPYAQALADLVDARLAATGRAVLLDLHSYPVRALPYELHAADRRPQVCLGTDDAHTPAWLLHAARTAFAGLEVGVNEPFRGTYVPLRHHGRDRRVSSLMVEVRRDVPPDGPAVIGALTALVAAATGAVG